MLKSLTNKRILLIITGGIATYKVPDIIRKIQEEGATTQCVVTDNATKFITPLTLGSVSHGKIYQNLFDLKDEIEMGHIQLSRKADLILVIPATANFIAKMAHGLADDLATTTILAANKPIMIVPAMNAHMWSHHTTQKNIKTLQENGIQLIEPEQGMMACGETGYGRLPKTSEIINIVIQHFSHASHRPLAGKRALVTAGPTHEPIDPIRFISNHSSGKQGYAIAESLAHLGAETTLISGPVPLSPPSHVTIQSVKTADEMYKACQTALPCDIAVMTAAVSDWRVKHVSDIKIKKSSQSPAQELTLVENRDILQALSQNKQRPTLLIGFAAETDNILEYAQNKLLRKKCDWLIANDISTRHDIEGGIMGSDFTQIHFLSQEYQETWPKMSKKTMAQRLSERIVLHFNSLTPDRKKPQK